MRTTLSIDDDVLVAAKAIADREGRSAGKVLSELARRSLHDGGKPCFRNGIKLLPARDDNVVVTLELVNRLRDELP